MWRFLALRSVSGDVASIREGLQIKPFAAGLQEIFFRHCGLAPPHQFTSYLNCHKFTWEHPSLKRNKGNTILLAIPTRIVKGNFQKENHSA
jgi:hypothetical protein